MLINPARETFLNFPSALLPDKTITVFLPEPAVPLHQRYPVVYVLGAIPKDAPAVQEVLDSATHKAIIVGINTEEADLKDMARLATFVSRELIPYIETNYPVLDYPTARALVVQHAAGLRAAAVLLAKKDLFARAIFWHPAEQAVALAGTDEQLRILVAGTRGEIVPMQQTLQEKGLAYGSGFVTRIVEDEKVWKSVNLDYLFALDDTLQIKKIVGNITPNILSIPLKQSAELGWTVVLANQMQFDYIPLSLRISPPYLQWDPQTGRVSILAGAVPGTVKMNLFVDNRKWRGKIKLKNS